MAKYNVKATFFAVTGVRPTLFRCPYGEYDDHVISAVRSLGSGTWNVPQQRKGKCSQKFHTFSKKLKKKTGEI